MDEDDFDEMKMLRLETNKLLAVKEVTQMPGWLIIMEHFNLEIKSIVDRLAEEESPRQIRILQAQLKAFRSMLQTVDALCEQHSVTAARLESMESDNNERDEYTNV